MAPILLGSIASLAPVLRGGGHERLTAGFAETRSWPGLVLANLAAVTAVVAPPRVLAFVVGLWAVDTARRAGRFAGRLGGA